MRNVHPFPVLGSEAWLAYELILASATFAHFLCSLYHQLIFNSLQLDTPMSEFLNEVFVCLSFFFFRFFKNTFFTNRVI